MKRLQVCDECYVRNGCGDLYRATVKIAQKGSLEVNIPSMPCPQTLLTGSCYYHYKNKYYSNLWSLVYPHQIIKQLAT